MGQEEAGRLPHLGDQCVQVVGGGLPCERLNRLLGRHLRQQAVLGVVDQLRLLALLDGLDGQPELLGDLVMRAGIQIGHPGVHVQQRRDRTQCQFAWAGLVVDIGLRQRIFGVLAAFLGVDGHPLRVHHAVDAVDAGLDGHPTEQMQQPARGDGGQLGDRLGRVGQLPRGRCTERLRLVLGRRHVLPPGCVGGPFERCAPSSSSKRCAGAR